MISIVITAALFFNYPSIRTVLTYQGGGVLEITGEHHYLVEPAYQYLVGRLTTQDVLVTDVLRTYDEIYGRQFPALNVLRFMNSDPLTIIEENPQGWIAFAHPTDTAYIQFSDFDYAGRHIHYIGMIGEVHLWEWGEVIQ